MLLGKRSKARESIGRHPALPQKEMISPEIPLSLHERKISILDLLTNRRLPRPAESAVPDRSKLHYEEMYIPIPNPVHRSTGPSTQKKTDTSLEMSLISDKSAMSTPELHQRKLS